MSQSMMEPNNNILQEHAFYETGNLKLLLPLMKLQSYEVPTEESSDYNGYGLVGLLVIIAIIGFVLKRRRNKVKKTLSMV